jgi:acetoin utilization protein AcuC
MSGEVRLVWSEEFMSYRLSEDHPLQPLRVKLTVELIREMGLTEYAQLLPPRRASDQEIGLCHAPHYIDVVRGLSDPKRRSAIESRQVYEHGFGTGDNPIGTDMHEGAAYIVGGSLVAAEAVYTGAALHAFNPAGGLHHALRDRASGFCVYNDVAVAVAWLRQRGHRVACVDVDVHHGDGTQALFYDDPQVLTISLHESGHYLFPGTGFPAEIGKGPGKGTSANLPLSPHTWDEPWLVAFEAVVPPLLRAFKPTVLVTQDGCDSHFLDPLSHLRNSTAIWPPVAARFHELAHEMCGGRWVALGGGGYAIREVVPRAWTLLFAEMVEHPELARSLIDPDQFPPADAERHLTWRTLESELDDLSTQLGIKLSLRGV